jgi:hypothetical protein
VVLALREGCGPRKHLASTGGDQTVCNPQSKKRCSHSRRGVAGSGTEPAGGPCAIRLVEFPANELCDSLGVIERRRSGAETGTSGKQRPRRLGSSPVIEASSYLELT